MSSPSIHIRRTALWGNFCPSPPLVPCWQGFNALFEQMLSYLSPNLDSNRKPQEALECLLCRLLFFFYVQVITSWVVALIVVANDLGPGQLQSATAGVFGAAIWCKMWPTLGQCVKVWPKTWSMCQSVTINFLAWQNLTKAFFMFTFWRKNCPRSVLFVIHFWHCFDCDHSTHLTCRICKIIEDRTRNVCSRTWRAHGAY